MQSQANNWARGAVYGQPLRTRKPKKSMQTTETLNQSLPAINAGVPLKANAIRSQLSSAKSQITQMQAKIKTLKLVKERLEIKNKHHSSKIEFLNTIRNRVQSDNIYKDRVRQQRHQSQQVLKAQVQELRESLVRQRDHAKNTLMQQKLYEAEEQRQKRKHHQYLIQKLKQIDQEQGARKVQRVRQMQGEGGSRLKDYQHSRVNLSRQNYQKKVLTTLKEKENAKLTLSRLQQEEQRLLKEVKSSEKTMLTSLYKLTTINPQARKRGSFRQMKSHESCDELYVNECFES